MAYIINNLLKAVSFVVQRIVDATEKIKSHDASPFLSKSISWNRYERKDKPIKFEPVSDPCKVNVDYLAKPIEADYCLSIIIID